MIHIKIYFHMSGLFYTIRIANPLLIFSSILSDLKRSAHDPLSGSDTESISSYQLFLLILHRDSTPLIGCSII